MQQQSKSLRLFKHIFSSRHTLGFGVHSPFMFKIIRDVIYEKNSYYVYQQIEGLRAELLSNKNKIYINDFGTGKSAERTIAKVASKSLKRKKYGQLLYRLVREAQPETIVELGTSFGLTTMYLATAAQSNCYSFEGSSACVEIAKANFSSLGVENIQLIEGDIDEHLEAKLNAIKEVGFAFIDANHTYESLMKYFDLIVSKSSSYAVVVVDDINWSCDTNKAWEEIKQRSCVTSTIDLFEMGIVFLNPELHKKHYKLIF